MQIFYPGPTSSLPAPLLALCHYLTDSSLSLSLSLNGFHLNPISADRRTGRNFHDFRNSYSPIFLLFSSPQCLHVNQYPFNPTLHLSGRNLIIFSPQTLTQGLTMTSLKELLASEGCKKGRKRSSVAADRGAERKGAVCEYRLVSNERSIDIYEEVSSKHAWGKSQKELRCKYNKSYSNPIYEDEIIYSRYFENTVKSFYCVPSLKEAAIQAVILILTGHVQCFATEGAFRALLHQSCAVCLARDGRLFADLKEVIVLIERIVSFGFDLNQLNNASLKLKELISGATDSRLLTCANLYLGIVYKLLRKDKASAKHLLKVFVWSPFQARIYILPELWDRLFAPHLSHFKLWYDKEVGSLVVSPSWEKRMKSIYTIYNDLVNKGTHDLAMYYLKWIKGEEKGLWEIAYLHKADHIEELRYPYRTDIPQGRENELLLRKLARESFKPQQVLHV